MSQPPPAIEQNPRFLLLGAACLAAVLGGFAIVQAATISRWALLALVPAFAWPPASAWLLWRGHARAGRQDTRLATLQADRQLDRFRVARRDSLTGLQNRQSFLETMAAQFAQGASFAVALIDLDDFDGLNANLGDAVGDEVLTGFAARLRAACAERDHAARLDGNGFAVLLTKPAELEQLAATAGRLLSQLSSPHPAGGQLVDVGVSIGIAVAPMHGLSAETLLRAARLCLLDAKRAGGGRWQLCGQAMAAEVLSRQRVRRELQRAIDAGQIVPYYQPIVSLPSGATAKFEVLARWRHPELGLLLPDQFIPRADELGLSGQISMALLRQVAQDTQDWPAWCRFAINVSPGQVRELIGLLNTQPGAWQRRMDLSRLDVEVSEAALMQDRALARELIDVLHEHGARAVLDNFGSGSSNYFHLRDMPFDSIKIGKLFIQTMTQDPRAEACVMSMLWLGLGLGVDIVADGVETDEVADRLGELGCHFAQGFLYARPMPAAEAGEKLGVAAEVSEAA